MNRKLIFGFLITFTLMASLSFIPITFEDAIPVSSTDEIRVLQYNIHFGLEVNVGFEIDKFTEVITEVKPNIVGMQEMVINFPGNGFLDVYTSMVDIMDSLGYEYYYVSKGSIAYLKNAFFSQYEILNASTYFYSVNEVYSRNLIRMVLDVNGIETVIYVTHITHLTETETVSTQMEELTSLISDDLVNYDNVITMGDFNLEPDSAEIIKMGELLNDSWSVANPGEAGPTFPSDIEVLDSPLIRIDYIFVSSLIGVLGCDIYNTHFSDHLPLHCDVKLS